MLERDQIGDDIVGYLKLDAAKERLRFITCGAVDDGKSTLIGRLLYDSKMICEDQLTGLVAESQKFGTQDGEVDLALLVDGLAAEREQGITIDVAYRYFTTSRRKFIIADTPGHEQYTRNMATGASTASVAIILVDARKGVLTQTRRHALIVSMLGIKHIVLAVNKMGLIDYDQDGFEQITMDFMALNQRLQFTQVQPIPISALNGDNILGASEKTPWFSGPSLMRYLEEVEVGTDQNAAFRYPVQFVVRPNQEFRGYAGQVASGAVTTGDRVKILPSAQ